MEEKETFFIFLEKIFDNKYTFDEYVDSIYICMFNEYTDLTNFALYCYLKCSPFHFKKLKLFERISMKYEPDINFFKNIKNILFLLEKKIIDELDNYNKEFLLQDLYFLQGYIVFAHSKKLQYNEITNLYKQIKQLLTKYNKTLKIAWFQKNFKDPNIIRSFNTLERSLNISK